MTAVGPLASCPPLAISRSASTGRRHPRAHQSPRISDLREALASLGASPSVNELLDRTCGEAVRACGVRRVALSVPDGPGWRCRAAQPMVLSRPTIEDFLHPTAALAPSSVEARVIATRQPALVTTGHAPELLSLQPPPTAARGYVIVPIVAEDRVVALLHADQHPLRDAVDAADRDRLWYFARGVGRIIERIRLSDRLCEQRTAVRAMFTGAEATVEAIRSAELSLAHPQDDSGADAGPPTTADMSQDVARLLTRRERDVLALMIRGLSNAAIAERLVIKPGTVKCHVKSILRKLGAVNRAQLIGRARESLDGPNGLNQALRRAP